MKLKQITVCALAVCVGGCGEWRPYRLHNPKTGDSTACFTSWGTSLVQGGTSLPEKELRFLHDCISACEARGYVLTDPRDVPPDPNSQLDHRVISVPQCNGSK